MITPGTPAIPGPGDRVTAHYRTLLTANYTWMLGGDIEAAAAEQRTILDTMLAPPGGIHLGLAVDLGCGSGAQSLALADLGLDPVLAVGTDPALLTELRSHAADRPTIRAVRSTRSPASMDSGRARSRQ